MTTDITKKQKIIIIRNRIEIFVDEGLGDKFQEILDGLTEHKFIRFNGRSINTADCTGVYLPEDMEDLKWRKNGYWKCEYQHWHPKGELCDCGRIPRVQSEPEPIKINIKNQRQLLNKLRQNLTEKGVLLTESL